MSVDNKGDNSAPLFESLSETDKWFWHQGIMWLLLAFGLILILFANPLGESLNPKTQSAPNAWQSSPDKARSIAATVRTVGCMVFAAGLVERLVIAVKNTKF